MHDVVEEAVMLPGGRELSVLRPRDSESLLDEHAFESDEFLPYWAELWPSGVALAREIAPRALRGARVVELGCGLGLPSLAAAQAGGRVLATDWAAPALDLLRENAARNDVEVELERVDWSRPSELLARGPFDLVLAADVLYERRNLPPLLDVLRRLGAPVWLADPGRPPLEEFLAHWEVERRGMVYRLS